MFVTFPNTTRFVKILRRDLNFHSFLGVWKSDRTSWYFKFDILHESWLAINTTNLIVFHFSQTRYSCTFARSGKVICWFPNSLEELLLELSLGVCVLLTVFGFSQLKIAVLRRKLNKGWKKSKTKACNIFGAHDFTQQVINNYPPLSPRRWIIVLVYTTQAEQLVDQRVTLRITLLETGSLLRGE